MKVSAKALLVVLCVTILSALLGCGGESGRRMGGIVYYTNDMSRVEAVRHIPYNKESGMDIYYPLISAGQEKQHTVILVHGKSPEDNLKNTGFYRSWGELLAASGFTAITFDWRLPKDITDLIAFVRNNAAEYRVDSESITVFAFSAGVDDGFRQALSLEGDYIKSVVGYYGSPPRNILNKKEELPPILLAIAGLDNQGFINSSLKFYEEAKSRGFYITKLEHPKGQHVFDMVNDDDTSRAIILQTVDFIKATISK